MTLLLIFAFAVLSAVTVFMMVSPFLGSREDQVRTEVLEVEMKRIEDLVAKKAVLLNSLRELQFEYETSKITDADYKVFRSRYERQAVSVMRELDAIHGGRGWEERIDLEIQSRLGESKSKKKSKKVRKRKTTKKGSSQGSKKSIELNESEPDVGSLICAKCGQELELSDKFCGQCGATVGAHEEATA